VENVVLIREPERQRDVAHGLVDNVEFGTMQRQNLHTLALAEHALKGLEPAVPADPPAADMRTIARFAEEFDLPLGKARGQG